MYNVQTVLEPP